MSEADRSYLITRWTLQSSPSEQDRMERAERMVINAIEAHPPFKDFTDRFRVYAKGSYANQTNVRQDSDVDVVVENADVYYSEYVDVTTAAAATPDPTLGAIRGPVEVGHLFDARPQSDRVHEQQHAEMIALIPGATYAFVSLLRA